MLTPTPAKSRAARDCHRVIQKVHLRTLSLMARRPAAKSQGRSCQRETIRLSANTVAETAVRLTESDKGQLSNEKTSSDLIGSHRCIERFVRVILGHSSTQVPSNR